MSEKNKDEGALVVVEVSDFMPVLSVDQALGRYQELVQFVKGVMIEDKDFGTIPGTAKPTLYKPGAEKLTTFFGLTVQFVDERSQEQWGDDGVEPFFYYMRKCQLWRGEMLIAEASGSCNSREGRYRWRWVKEHEVPASLDKTTLQKRSDVAEEFKFAIDKAETSGKYGKPQAYWDKFRAAMQNKKAVQFQKEARSGKSFEAWRIESVAYRVPNEDIFSLVNTILKMCEKRALVAATLIACNASEFFTQDIEDGGIVANVQDAVFIEATPKQSTSDQVESISPTTKPSEQKIKEKAAATQPKADAPHPFTLAADLDVKPVIAEIAKLTAEHEKRGNTITRSQQGGLIGAMTNATKAVNPDWKTGKKGEIRLVRHAVTSLFTGAPEWSQGLIVTLYHRWKPAKHGQASNSPWLISPEAQAEFLALWQYFNKTAADDLIKVVYGEKAAKLMVGLPTVLD